MTNERLRSAIYSAGMTINQVSEQIEVDPKTVERWITKDRIPHRANRQRIALTLHTDERAIWPGIGPTRIDATNAVSEIVQIYPSRGSIPTETWISLIDAAVERIDILAFAGSFLHDALPDFVGLLRERAESGIQVRLAFGEPGSQAVAIRGDDEGIGESLRDRCRLTWKYLRPLAGTRGIEMREHRSTLYQSLFCFDADILVNQHTYGRAASRAPVLHLRYDQTGILGPAFRGAFERVWDTGTPHTWGQARQSVMRRSDGGHPAKRPM